VDDDVTVRCAPPSETFFKVDTTAVTSTATDDAGNTAERSFNVTVVVTYGPYGNPDVNQGPGPGQRERASPRAE
jgi:HYR domain